jgi:hypothetical protein
MQGYLFKLPFAFVELFPELIEVPRFPVGAEAAEGGASTVAPPERSGSAERPPFFPKNEEVRSRQARPWSRDPSEVDRALSSHARVERLVAEAAAGEGWDARGYGPGDPVFDLLLKRDDSVGPSVVVEVKSTTGTNEEKQLRLALGQVLRYRWLLEAEGHAVVAFVAVEKPPRDPSWIQLCERSGVSLVWPSVVPAALRELTSLSAEPDST